MRCSWLSVSIALISAICPLSGVGAHPTPSESVAGVVDDRFLYRLEERGASSVNIAFLKESNHATWVGYRLLPGMFGAQIVSNDKVKEVAYELYQSIEKNLPTPGLVAAIYVPKGGWAAGTIWFGTDEAFKDFARYSESFWNAVPGDQQALKGNMNGVHMWHAEAVAVAKAESEFGDAMVDGLFPEGSKIAVYGKWWEGGTLVTGYKAPCSVTSSQVNSPCLGWLRSLRITAV